MKMFRASLCRRDRLRIRNESKTGKFEDDGRE